MSYKNKVFVGTANIAGSVMLVSKALRLAGINATSYSYRPHPFGYQCDYDNILFESPYIATERTLLQKIFINKYSLNLIWYQQKLWLFIRSIIKYDSFIFISHETFFKNNRDLPILKLLNKKIIFLFLGCPERDPSDLTNTTDGGFCSFCKDYPLQNHLNCHNGNKKQIKIKYISDYADIIFTHKDTAGFIKNKNKIKPFYCISEKRTTEANIRKKFSGNIITSITHLPSNALLKGTAFVEKSVGELKAIGISFEYNSKRVKHDEISPILEESHILIDQFASSHGSLAIEAMAHGCVVICRTADWFKDDFPDLPVISCEPENLTSTIQDLLANKEKMKEIALKSYNYYLKFHTPEVVGNYIKNVSKLN